MSSLAFACIKPKRSDGDDINMEENAVEQILFAQTGGQSEKDKSELSAASPEAHKDGRLAYPTHSKNGSVDWIGCGYLEEM